MRQETCLLLPKKDCRSQSANRKKQQQAKKRNGMHRRNKYTSEAERKCYHHHNQKHTHAHLTHSLLEFTEKIFIRKTHFQEEQSQTGKRKQEKDQRSMYELRTWRESDSKQTWERDTEETRPEQSTLFIDTVKRIDEGLQTKEHMTNLYTNRTRHPLPVKIESHGWSSSSSQRRPKREDEQQETEAGSCTTAG